MLPPRDVRPSMRLHGDTVFIPENQETRLQNCCISIQLEKEVRVNVESVERREERDWRETREEGQVCLVYLVYLVR